MRGKQQQCKSVNLIIDFLDKTQTSSSEDHVVLPIFRCWISDAGIHQGVNIGYYAVVFVFTLSVFILTVRQIVLMPKAGKAQDNSSIKSNTSTILGLFLLLGITWAFAFFSYGPLLLASYYIFTILNSFQGKSKTVTVS